MNNASSPGFLPSVPPQATYEYTFTTYFPPPFEPTPCPGCGLSYLTMCAATSPHNPAVCEAYKRGYEAGLAMAGVKSGT